MKTINYTKGEWIIVDGILAPHFKEKDCKSIMSGQAPICLITDNWIPNGMNEANAILISQSPKMLEAIQLLLLAVKHGDVQMYNSGTNEDKYVDYLQILENSIKPIML